MSERFTAALPPAEFARVFATAVPLSGGRSLLGAGCLRSAGFPVDRLESLAAPELARAASALAAADAATVLAIAADVVESLQEGWAACLGELHVMTNLMAQRLMSKNCPVEDALIAATARVQRLPELVPVPSADAKGPRTTYNLAVPHDVHIAFERNVPRGGVEHVRIADLVVRHGAEGSEVTERHVALRRWAARAGLPRHAFYRLEGELKPLFLDLDSLPCCDLFADGVRRLGAAAVVTAGEMLPAPEQCWLRDAAGRRYTAELRLAAYPGTNGG